MSLQHFSRSHQLDSQACPYRAWLTYGYRLPGAAVAGIQSRSLRAGMNIGSCFHEGMAKALSGASEEESVGHALEEWAKVKDRIVGEHGEEFKSFNLRQAGCFVEQLTRVAFRVALPELRARYRISEVERELKVTLPLPSGPLHWASRIDGGLAERTGLTEAHGVLSWKTCAGWDDRKVNEASVDIQGLSEPWAASQVLNRRIDFVQMVFLAKGRKSEKQEDGTWFHYSPLTTGMVSKGQPGGPQYSWKYNKGMERFFIFEPNSPFTPKDWLDALQAGEIGPFNEDPLGSSLKILDPIWRPAEAQSQWLGQMSAEAERHRAAYREVDSASLDPNDPKGIEEILKVLPRHTRSCLWPVKCQFHDHCHLGDRVDDPEKWVAREPNHPEDGED